MPRSAFPVVVVGASAGGVELLHQLVRGLPVPLAAPVLIVLHIPAHVKSDLATVLQPSTLIPVSDARNGAKLEPGHIYVATPDRHLVITPTTMRLTHAPKESQARPAIDALFRSAADSFGSAAIGVLLSGMLDDGTSGLWAIKDRGGVALVQGDPPVAFASMPENAAMQVDVDAVVPAGELGHLIGAHVARISTALGAEAPTSVDGFALKDSTRGLGMSGSSRRDRHDGGPAGALRSRGELFMHDGGRVSSMNTLLHDIDDAIDRGLCDTLRAVDERVLLLREMALAAKDCGSNSLADDYSIQAEDAEARHEPLRQLVLRASL